MHLLRILLELWVSHAPLEHTSGEVKSQTHMHFLSTLLELGMCHTIHLDTRCQKDEGKPDPQASKLDKARGRPEAPEGPSPGACGIQSVSTSTGCLKHRFLAEHQSKPEENTQSQEEDPNTHAHAHTCTHRDLGSRVVTAKRPKHQQTNTTFAFA